MRRIARLLVAALSATASGADASRASEQIPVFGYRVIASWPHDRLAVTEGLALYRGMLYESATRRDRAVVRKVALRTGRVLKGVTLRRGHAAEGLTIFRGLVFQATLRGTGFVYDRVLLRRLRTFRYAGQAWGLTHYRGQLVLSDGSDRLRFLDARTLAVRRTIAVRDEGRSVTHLNELELVNGAICANIFPTPRIACIDPASGRVRYWVDLTGLLSPSLQPNDEEAVANGIAYGGRAGRILVTGKLWPRVFEIRLVPKS